jgi:hypothetical protein
VRENSWKRFIMPDKLDRSNYIQKALNYTQRMSNREDAEDYKKEERFRNHFEHFAHLIIEEKSENITVEQTQARMVEANKKYQKAMSKAKPEAKIF